jgi:hypothetical protein
MLDSLKVEHYISNNLVKDGWVSTKTAVKVVQIFHKLLKHIPKIQMPTVAPGPDGVVGLTWQDTKNYLNLEIFEDCHIEMFHEDLISGLLWSEEGSELSDEFINKLSLINAS